MKRTKSKPARRHVRTQPHKQEPEKLPFIAHVYELRKRLFYIAVSVGTFGGVAAGFQEQLSALLLKPAAGQQFIYTSPGGGFDYAFRLCLYTGVTLSVPVIVFQVIRYLEPLVKKQTARFIAWFSIASGIMAGAGMTFAYFIGLPAGLHFLLQNFSSDQIKALINIQSYLSFVMVYLLGSALLFQIPLVMLFINRIKPLQPKKLMKMQRWVFLIAFVLGAIISPSPDIRNQALLSGPIILMYECSVIMIWLINRRHRKPKKVVAMIQKDATVQAERMAKFQKAQEAWRELLDQSQPSLSEPARPTAAPAAVKPKSMTINKQPAKPNRPSRYIHEFNRRPPKRRIVVPIQQAD